MTEASRALGIARKTARLRSREVAEALGVHPRTVRRWEAGDSHPDARQWRALVAVLFPHAAGEARALAQAAHVPSPVSQTYDPAACVAVVSAAADTLDVSPRRVRDVLRAVGQAAHRLGVPFDVVVAAANEEAAFAAGTSATP